jgi:serine/threonine protein kinase/tetratricopeptide (TPR) repeat protein
MIGAGERLGPYTVVAALGSGGMGVVFRATDPRLGRDVAIKLLPDHLSSDANALGRFEREVRALAALSHSNIVTIFDFGTEKGVTYAVTELLEGETLRARIARSTLTAEETLSIGTAVAEGLAAAHAKGIIHRDLKPENIFLLSGGGTKILDFGLAHWDAPNAAPSPADTEPDPDAGLLDTATDLDFGLALTQTYPATPPGAPGGQPLRTRPGVVMGTFHYMSPEQTLGHPLDARTDIFSFGGVLYEMATGTAPFPGATAAEITAAILHDVPRRLRDPVGLPNPGLWDLIRRCLEKERERRFQTARELVAALKAASGSRSSGGFPIPGRDDRPGMTGTDPGRSQAAVDSIAVLPLANAGRDPEMDYLGEGLAESIINTLAQLPRLRVKALSVVLRYKGRDVDPQEAGRELGVGAVLLGRVLQRGEDLNVGVELVRVADGSRIWGEQFRRKPADLMAVQEEIAREVSAKLRIKLSGEHERVLGRRYTDNAEAYRAYLRGRYFWNLRTAEGFKKGIEEFSRAAALDPNFSLAYAGLADIYILAETYQAVPGTFSLPKAKAYALRALEIDPELAEAYPPLSAVTFVIDHDLAGADAMLRRAIELNPNYATAHQWYAVLLVAEGRHDQAVEEARLAVELDPLSRSINMALGIFYYYARRFDLAVEQLRKTLEIDETYTWARDWLGQSYVAQGRTSEAIDELRRACSLSGNHPNSVAILAVAYAAAGRRDEALASLAELNDLSTRRYVSALNRAHVHAALDQPDETFAWLRKACDEYNVLTLWVLSDPLYDRLHSDPRFIDIARLLGLP